MKHIVPFLFSAIVLMSFDSPRERDEKIRRVIVQHYSKGFTEGKVDSVEMEVHPLTEKFVLQERIADLKSAIGQVTKLYPTYDKVLAGTEEHRKKCLENHQSTGHDDTLLRNYHAAYEKGKLQVQQYHIPLDSMQLLYDKADSVTLTGYKVRCIAYYRTSKGPNQFWRLLNLDTNYKVLENYNSLKDLVRARGN